MPARRQVTCITKRGNHYDPHERITHIGGLGWRVTSEQAITDLLSSPGCYYVSAGGRTVDVIVATHNGRRYLKTTADGYAPDNLLALPEC